MPYRPQYIERRDSLGRLIKSSQFDLVRNAIHAQRRDLDLEQTQMEDYCYFAKLYFNYLTYQEKEAFCTMLIISSPDEELRLLSLLFTGKLSELFPP